MVSDGRRGWCPVACPSALPYNHLLGSLPECYHHPRKSCIDWINCFNGFRCFHSSLSDIQTTIRCYSHSGAKNGTADLGTDRIFGTNADANGNTIIPYGGGMAIVINVSFVDFVLGETKRCEWWVFDSLFLSLLISIDLTLISCEFDFKSM